MFDCINKVYKQDGVKGFYRGIVPNLIKNIPAISISYAVFEKLKKELI